jgi:anoctamin-10
MASLADAIVKGGFGTIGVIASAYTLTKFIIATPVKIGDRSDEERDKDVVLCFDVKAFSPAAIAFFLDSVRAQSRLRIDKKRVHSHKPITATATGDDATVQDPEVMAEAQGEAYYLVGATTEVLKQIKARKRKMQHAEIFDETDGKPLTSGERIELLMFELNRLLVFAPASGTEASIPSPFQVNDSLFAQALHSRLIKEHFPLHDDRERHDLVETWVKKYDQPQPLDAVHDYFGDEIGFYFAFLGMYTKWLVVPTAIGVVVFLVEALTPWSAYGRAFYSLFITSWATAFLKFWRRRESTLRDQWDISVTDTLALDQERPEFSGERRYDPVEDRHFTYFSSIKRMQRYLVTSVVTLAVLGVILKLMFLYFDIDKWVGEQVTLEKGWDGYYQYASLAPSVAYSIVVLLLDMKYLELATWLTKMENHRTDADVRGDDLCDMLTID